MSEFRALVRQERSTGPVRGTGVTVVRLRFARGSPPLLASGLSSRR